MCSVGHESQGNRCLPSLNVDLTSVSTSSYLGISPQLFPPPPVCSVHFGIEAFRWRIALEGMLRGVNMMLGVRWVPLQPCHAFDDVSIPVLDRALVIVIRFDILWSV